MSGANFKIKNFQSIVDANIRVEGFTILIGESSQGKSACLRAINAACNNKFKQGFLRYGADMIEIGISYDGNPNTLVVRKTKTGSPEYELGNLVFQKLNRTVPPEIDEFNNFGSIDAYEQKYPLNFFTQFSKPLLLEFSQKRILEILSSSKAFDDMNEAVSKLNKKKDQNTGAFKQLSQMVSENKAQLSKYAAVEEQMHDSVENLNTCMKQLQECENQAESCDKLLEHINAYEKEKTRSEMIESFISDCDKFEQYREDISQLTLLEHLVTEQGEIKKRIKTVSDEIGLCETYIAKENELNKLRVDSIIELENLMNESKAEQKKIREIQSVYSELEKCMDMKKQVSDIDSDIRKLDYVLELMDSYRQDYKTAKSIQSMIENKICPVCGNKITV